MDTIHAFSKSVRHTRIDHQSIADFAHIGKIEEIIEKLEKLSGTEEAILTELNIDSNPKDWITSLLVNYPDKINEELMRYLLYDFTDKMKTRMREETKYVIGLLLSKRLTLCHSLFGGETITPTWDIIPRMLDTDNVIRYVSFITDDNIIKVKFWEKYSTNSFIDWLGLRRKKGFLFGGPYRIRSEIEGMNVEFQLDDEQIENLILGHPEFKKGQISLSSPVHMLNVETIKVGAKEYDNSEDFLQIYQADKYGVLPYMEKYEQLNKAILPVLYKYIDEEKQVISISGGEVSIQLTKDLPNIEILFANEFIEIGTAYLRKLIAKFVNNEHMKIFHAGCEFNDLPITLGNIELYNKLVVDELTNLFVNFYQSVKLYDKDLDLIIKYLVLLRLCQTNIHLPITRFLTQFAGEVINTFSIQSPQWTKLEDSIIEYKSADCFSGNNNEVIQKLADDVENKLSSNIIKLYIFGVEDDGKLKYVASSKLPSDRLDKICSGLQKELEKKGFSNLDIFPCRIPVDDNFIVIVAFRRF